MSHGTGGGCGEEVAKARGSLAERESWWEVRAVKGPEGLGEGLGAQEVTKKNHFPLSGNGGQSSPFPPRMY